MFAGIARPTEDEALRNILFMDMLKNSLKEDSPSFMCWAMERKERVYLDSGCSPDEALVNVARDYMMPVERVTAILERVSMALLLKEGRL